MSQLTIAQYLEYAHLQMAAEAFIRDESNPNIFRGQGDGLISALVDGNRHSSRFVKTQAEQFSTEWEVLDQRANTKTGFSGTLFRNRDTNEIVLSFRSTEFIDDAARDNKATNELEIKETGFAWGQIADMQQWYAELKNDATKLGAGQAFSVTGYSLGGHLATAFNLLNAGAAERVVTFNGAGVGLVKNGTLQDALAEFNELRTSPDSLAARFTHPGLATFYRRIQAELFSGQTTVAQAQADLNALYTDANTGVTVLGSQATTLMKALKGIETLGNEAVRVTTLVAGGTENPNASPKPVLAQDIAGMDLNYRLAMLFAGEHTQSASIPAGAVQGFGGKQYAGSLGNQYDVVGDTSPSVVANSQWHYGQDVRVGIEDQPLYRGGIGAGILMDAIALKSPALLVNQYAVKDFGDTHSLVLLVDSLSVQNTLLSLMPEGERNADGVPSLLKAIYQAATNQKRVDGDLLSGGSQGKAEGDLLEQLVNALADMVHGPQDKAKQLKGNPSGGTWARTKDQDGYMGRDKFFEIVEAVQKKIKDSSLSSQFKVLASTGRSLDGEARQSFGDYLALRLLSPFVLRTTDTPESVLAEMGRSWGAEYEDWKTDKALLAQGGSVDGLRISDQWLADRSAMLTRKNWFNTANKESFDLTYVAPNDPQGVASPYQLEDTLYEDAATGYKIRQGQITDATRHFLFGDDQADTLTGKGVVDHLYGGAGADTLSGLAGDDHLEGNAGNDEVDGGTGNDTLNGGAGTDIYRFSGAWGVDSIIDSDGQGSIKVNGETLAGGELVGTNAWQSTDKQWRYALTEQDDLIITHTSEPGRIIVRGWSAMKDKLAKPLGLELPGEASPQQPGPDPDPNNPIPIIPMYALQGGYFVPGGPQLPGGTWSIQSDGSIPGMLPIYNSNDLMVGGENEPNGLYERITGVRVDSEGNPRLTLGDTGAVSLWGLGGNDFMSGEQYDDYLDGGDGDDLIWGGAGNDIIVTNLAATHATYQEDPVQPGYVRGADTEFTYFGGQANYSGRWWVEKSEDGLHLKIPRAYVKNPEGGHTYWSEGENDRDTVDAGEGDDYVWGGRGADYLMGGAGEDHLAGLGGADVILGGEGKDLIFGDDWSAMRLAAVYDHDRDFGYLRSLPLDEALKSPALHGDDVIDAGAGDDEVWGDGGNELIFGGSGNDTLLGDALPSDLPIEYHGNDKLDGGDGNDVLIGLGKDDLLLGGGGNDQLQGDYAEMEGQYHGADVLDGGDGDDTLYGQGGADVLYGGTGNDLIEADDSLARLAAGFHGNDYVDGGEGNDTIFGQGGADALYGGAGNDWIAGEDETEVDSVSTLAGNDNIFGGDGDDTLVGGNGDDVLSGDEGDDFLYGGRGSDRLDGGTGRNALKGGAGDDTYVVTSDGTHIVSDAEGDNLVKDVEGLVAGTTLEGDLVLSSGTRTVVLTGALKGDFSGRIVAGGREMSVQDYVLDYVADPITVAGNTDGQRLSGGRGGDEFFANGSDTQVRGGKGNDQITFNRTGGRVVLGRADGRDKVLLAALPSHEAVATNKVSVQLGEGIDAADVSIEFDAATNALKLRYSPEPDDVLEVAYSGLVPPSVVDVPPIGEVRLADGTLLGLNFTAQRVDEDSAYSYQLPEQVFAGTGANAVVSATLADGQSLPDWLHFDPASRSFSGTPGNGDVGGLSVRVTAVDSGVTGAYSFALVVTNVNDAPQVGASLPAKTSLETFAWSYDLPEGAFADVDRGDALTYTARLVSGKPLPAWLRIDPKTGRLTHGGDYFRATHLSLVITATDVAGQSAAQPFELTVQSALGQSVLGTPENDDLIGTPGNDRLIGGLGNDVLDGGAGNDVLIGGNSRGTAVHVDQGSDTYLFGRGDGHDEIWNSASGEADTLKFKAGIKPEDIVVRRGPGAGSNWNSAPNSITFTIIDTGDMVTVPNFHAANGLGAGRVHAVTFTDHPGVVWDAETVSLLALQGSAGNDDIHGYASSDVLRGNAGDDQLRGLKGDDIYLFSKNDGKDIVYESANEGFDRLVFQAQVSPADVVIQRAVEGNLKDALVIKVVTGSTIITIPDFFAAGGVSGVDAVEFADGTIWNRDFIVANYQGVSAVANEFIGTDQDDHYIVDHRDDIVIEQVNEGVDSVESNVSYVLPQHVEDLRLTGYLPINGTGNRSANKIVGNDGNNVLDWGANSDNVQGLGGTGIDVLAGGIGDDVYRVFMPEAAEYEWVGPDVQPLWNFNIIEAPNAGVDQLQTNAFSAVLPDHVENLKIGPFLSSSYHYLPSYQRLVTRYVGNDIDNIIDASSLNSTFISTELEGGLGNDLLIGSVQRSTNWATYMSASAGVTVSLAISGTQDTGSAGHDTLQGIGNLKGSRYEDVLSGDARENILDGGAGPDRMEGAGGNDTYYVDDVGDEVIENEYSGKDQVYVKGLDKFVLPVHVESAEIQSSNGGTSASLQGNEEGNSLKIRGIADSTTEVILQGMGGDDSLQFVGSAATVVLDGGDGNDVLTGHEGSDVFIGGLGDDIFVASRWGGRDVVRSDEFASDAPQTNTLQLQEMSLQALVLRREGRNLRVGSSSSYVLVEGFFDQAGGLSDRSPVQRLHLTGGTPQILGAAEILSLVPSNLAPVAQVPLGAFEVQEGQQVVWRVPSGAFTDDGAVLIYSAALEDGSPLPDWVSFDESGRLSGLVPVDGNPNFRIKITATDEEGLSASDIVELSVRVGDQVIEGTDGDDSLWGQVGDDWLLGFNGNDQLRGAEGDDELDGGAGDDFLYGQAGSDFLLGGLGNDYLLGGPGNDVFEYAKGDGQDTVDATDAKTAIDKLYIFEWLPSQVQLLRSGLDLFLRMGATDQVTLYNYFQAETVQNGAPVNAKIDQIVFGNGDRWDQAKIASILASGGGNGSGGTSTGPGNPPPSTYTYAYVLANQYSNYTLSGNAPYVFKGNGKVNLLTGNDGANVINGAAGNDTLIGGKGGDTYFLETGTGQDTIVENDATSGAIDLLQWGSGIQHDQLWLRKAGNNLEISVIGKTDKATVKDWYLGDSRHVEQVWAGGKVLLDTKVQSLVDAMAAFAPPSAGQTTLPASYQSALLPVLAANWQ